MASDAPDGTSLMTVSGLSVPGATGNPLAMVTQFEYKALPPNDGVSTGDFWSKMPAAMGLTLLDQDTNSGMLTAKTYTNIDFSGVKGGWIHCGSTLSSWNTHIGSEEYEPDAKVRGGGAKAADSDDATDINSFSKYYFGNAATANPYHYGLVPEVTVDASGKATVVKHYAPGRFAREMQIGASDSRTFIAGDDGKATGLFMFVADSEKNLSAGTIYAAKVTQTAATGAGSYTLQWIRLGQATDADIRAMVDSGVKFSDIFQFSNTDPGDATYKKVVTYNGTEWLKVKPGMEKAAAFLETRRYAALLGATTEFSKMEYVAYQPARQEVLHRHLAHRDADDRRRRRHQGVPQRRRCDPRDGDHGQCRRTPLAAPSTVATSAPRSRRSRSWSGGWSTKLDAEGNACNQTQICGPDNIVYVDKIRTLFIGEDTSRRNNNYVWAFNIDDKRLTRILSTPMYAEATGLMAATDYNGHAYVMSNFQHAGDGKFDGTGSYKGSDAAAVGAAINQKWGNKKKAAIGYLGTTKGALPAFN